MGREQFILMLIMIFVNYLIIIVFHSRHTILLDCDLEHLSQDVNIPQLLIVVAKITVSAYHN